MSSSQGGEVWEVEVCESASLELTQLAPWLTPVSPEAQSRLLQDGVSGRCSAEAPVDC